MKMFNEKEKSGANEKTSLKSAIVNTSETPGDNQTPLSVHTTSEVKKTSSQLCSGNNKSVNSKYKTNDLNSPKTKDANEEQNSPGAESIQLTTLKNGQDAENGNNVVDAYQVKINLEEHNVENKSSWKITKKTLKRPLPCLFAWSLLISSTGVYFAFVSSELLSILDDFKYWIVIMSIQCVLFSYVVINFLIATLRDPGRFPKVIISPDDPSFNDDTKSPLYKTISIKKVNIKIKWCSV